MSPHTKSQGQKTVNFFISKKSIKNGYKQKIQMASYQTWSLRKKYIIKGIMKLLSKFILSKCILSLKYQPLLCVRKGWRFT